MISIGHRTRLFDVMASVSDATSADIASKANLNERYVREWLGALVTAKIVEYEPKEKAYSLSKEKADFLTRTGKFNMATTAQFIPVMAQVEDEIIHCFENGGGVPYESYNRFHKIMAEDSNQTVLAELIDGILPIVPGIKDKLNHGIKILDVGCGSGRAINLMAKTFPSSHFTGYDFSKEGIQDAKNEKEKLGLQNATFEQQDVTHFNHVEHFDMITAFDAIHDQAHPEKVLENIRRSLKSDGVFLMQDIAGSSHLEKNMDHPMAPFLYTVSCLHCMTVSLALDGKGLGAMWGKEKAIEMLNEAGFSNVEVKQLPHDPINYFYVARCQKYEE
jgi:ubiquinone/menaquinone biosynthesis C-methylase UbiE